MLTRARQPRLAFRLFTPLVLLSILTLSCTTDTPLGSRGAVAFSVLPVGTSETRIAANLAAPTAMALSPDGRIFVAEQCGTLRVIKNGVTLATPALTLAVDCTGERGLLGVAVDPDFTNNPRIYLYYTVLQAPIHNRISQFTLAGDLAGNEQILLDLDNLDPAADFHNGGALHFAPDGTLFIAVGDNGTGSNAQSLTTTFGKILRINVDGSVPADNPFFNSTSGRYRAIWATGFRNPFTFAFEPGTGRLFINDVGETTYEEIDEGLAGANYGWPTCEGPCTGNKPQFKDPFYYYSHTNGCAITGGTFYKPTSTRFPSSYIGKYMFADYCGGYINVLDPATQTVTSFSSGMEAPVDLQTSSDGGLFYLQRGAAATAGELWRVDGTTNQTPIITVQPAGILVSVGQPASFSVAATGTAPITYQWQRNGSPISGATSSTFTLPTTVLADSGAVFRCMVTNDYASVASGDAVLSVTSNLPPSADITSPAVGTLYKGGQTITYSATATDPETGALPGSAYTWEVVFHHDSHIHPFIAPTTGSSSGSFDVPTIGEKSANVYFAILLTVTDPIGLKQTFERDVFPLTSTITLQSTPSAAQLTLDGQPVTTPYSVLGVAGVQRTLGAVSPQTIGGVSYSFGTWSDGGGATHTVSTPDTNSSFTANYVQAAQAGGVVFAQANANTGVSVASLSVPLPSATSTGSLIVVGVDWASANFSSISDAQGNAFVQVGTQQATPGGVKSRFYYARNIKGGPETVTVSLSKADPSLQVYIAEYRGADPTNPLDVTSQRTGSAGVVSSGIVTTTSANDVLVGYCVSDGACTVPSGWNARSTHSNNLLEDRNQDSPGAAEATASSNNGWSMVLAAFRPAPASTAPVSSVTVTGPSSVVTGQSIQLSATLRDAAGNVLTGRVVTWSSGNASIASVSSSGLVTGVAAGGPVVINAVSEGVSGGLGVTVTAPPPPTAVTASVTAADKVYDGTTTATITSCALSGSPSGVSCSAASASFSDPAVGTNKTVTATGISLSGPNAGSYVLTSTTATTTASILAAPPPSSNVTFAQANAATGVSVPSLTVTLPAATSAGALIVVGIDWQTASFASVSDGQGNSFTQVGAQLSTPGGVKSRFYYAKNIKGGTEAVTVTLTGSDVSLQVYVAEYRGADVANPLDVTAQSTGTSSAVSSGFVTTTSANDQLVGYCVSDGTCSAGSGWTARSTHSGNLLEDRTQATTASVNASGTSNNGWSMVLAAFRPQQSPPVPVASVVVSPASASVLQGGTIQLSATTLDANGATLTGRTVSWSSGNSAVASVSASGLVTGVSAGGPVTISATSEGITGTAQITVTVPPPPTEVTASVTAANKVYDGTATATITSCTLSGSPAGVTCSAAAASFSDAAVGTAKTVTATGITLSGPNSASYVLTSTTASTTADILPPIQVTASVTAADKVYDGTTTATITSCTLSGSPTGVTCSAASASFADAAIGGGKTVTATGISLSGPKAVSYALTSTTATTTASILGGISFVQANARSANGRSNSISLPSAVTAGDLLVIGISWSGGSSLSSVTDNQGNSWTQIGTQAVTSNGKKTRLYYARNSKGGSTTVTVALSGNSSSFQVYAVEYRGASTTAPLDVTSQRTGSAGAVSSGNATTTSPNDQVLGFCVSDGSCTAGTGFTTRASANGGIIEDRVQSTTGTVAATGSATKSWVMIMAAFRP